MKLALQLLCCVSLLFGGCGHAPETSQQREARIAFYARRAERERLQELVRKYDASKLAIDNARQRIEELKEPEPVQ